MNNKTKMLVNILLMMLLSMLALVSIIMCTFFPILFIINTTFIIYNLIALARTYNSGYIDEALRITLSIGGIFATLLLVLVNYDNPTAFKIWDLRLDDVQLNKREQRQLKILKINNDKRLWIVKIKSFFFNRNREKYLKKILE